MSIQENARAHYAEKINLEPKCIDAHEWDSKIYYKPMNMKQKIELAKYIDNPFIYAVRALIARGLDEDGNRLFTGSDYTDMTRHYDSDVIERIVLEMSEDVEDVEKN